MARSKRKRKKPDQPARPEAQGPFHNPFKDKAKDIKKFLTPKEKAVPPPKTAPEPDEDELFLQAVSDVTRLDSDLQVALPQARSKAPPVEDEELEVLAQLADLVSGTAPLDIRDTDEYVQGARPNLNLDIVHRLSLGLFPLGDHLDLHGLTLTQAKTEVERFLNESRRMGHRCVLIIHGRGLSSPDGRPVLKPHLVGWLSKTGLRKHVLAFTSARPYDGGAGAMYVLLKK